MPPMLLLAEINWPQTITSLIVIVAVLHLLLGAAAYFILLERKICAWVQDRVGPNRVGPMGLLQPLADGLKLIVKEEFMPLGVDRVLFILAPVLTVMPPMIAFAVIPWAGHLDLSTIPFLNLTGTVSIAGATVNIGVIYLLSAASLGVYGVAIGGWASNNKFSFLGGLRASAQMISYEIPMGLTLLCIILMVGTVLPTEIIAAQMGGAEGVAGSGAGGFSGWFIIQHPLAAIIFYTCILAEANRTPFDLAEAESELVGGWHTEYSSMKWALFFMGEYINLAVGGAFFALLFLGGWSINPFGIGPDLVNAEGSFLIMLLQVGVMMGKAFALVFLTMMIRWTIPRFRFDQLMRLAWEGMIPASLLLLLVTAFMVYMGWTGWMWAASLGCLGIIYLVLPFMPHQRNPNRKIPLIGSRFSPLGE